VKLHELKPAKGSSKPRKRVGRGEGAGQGKTSGRGQKGQGSRSSFTLPTGFEGGQMPLKQRLPKLRGFHNRFRREYVVVNLGKLGRFEKGSVVDPDVLTEAGLIPRASSPVKVLAAGHLPHALTLKVHRISGAARLAVESAGGSIELLGQQPPAEGAEPVGKRERRKADAIVARRDLLSGKTSADAAAARSKRKKGDDDDDDADPKAKAKAPSKGKANDAPKAGGKKREAKTADAEPAAADAPAPDDEAETEDRE
jgi:large subunit ribosomal protein L15